MFAPLTFDPNFRPFLNDLARFQSTKELEDSSLYQKLKPQFDSILNQVWCGSADGDGQGGQRRRESIRAVAWNIERGIKLDGVIRCLQTDPWLVKADVLFLSE